MTLCAGGKPESQWSLCWRQGGSNKPGHFTGPPQCPHSTLSSTRSSVSSTPASPCPTPLPFLVTSGSVSSGMVPSVGANISPDETFGSIRSLSVSREVASFPLSRTPTPPLLMSTDRLASQPLPLPDDSSMVPSARIQLPPLRQVPLLPSSHTEITMVAPALSCDTEETKVVRGPRKSVSIVLPNEDKG
uniref:(California timema) hypothetical protein n=1 Tax=Timema californicum TaxID=61474 RepID=A0A7R9JB28_TIMCA|nr:unnamed protein product [Timema californicum]